MDTPDLFDVPAPPVPVAPRRDTSAEAGRAIKGRAPALRNKCLRALRETGPMTSDECANELGIDRLAIRPRFTELSHASVIIDSGQRRRNTSGKAAIVWRLKTERDGS